MEGVQKRDREEKRKRVRNVERKKKRKENDEKQHEVKKSDMTYQGVIEYNNTLP